MPVFLSSSRKPCARTRTLLKDFNRLLPDSVMVNRGKTGVSGLVDAARNKGLGRVAIVGDRHGNPGEIRFIELDEDSWDWLPIRLRIRSIKLARDFDGPMPKASALEATDGMIANAFGIESEEGDVRMDFDGTKLSFWKGDDEIGPRLLVEVLKDEA